MHGRLGELVALISGKRWKQAQKLAGVTDYPFKATKVVDRDCSPGD